MTSNADAVVSAYLDRIQKECKEKGWNLLQEQEPAILADLRLEPPEVQIAFIKAAICHAEILLERPGRVGTTFVGGLLSMIFGPGIPVRSMDWVGVGMLGKASTALLRFPLPWDEDDLAKILKAYARNLHQFLHTFKIQALLAAAGSAPRTAKVIEAMGNLRQEMATYARRSNSKQNRDFLERIDAYLNPGEQARLRRAGPWSEAVFAEIDKKPAAEREAWTKIFAHCQDAKTSAPSKAWRKRAQALVAEIGTEKFRESATRWLNHEIVPPTAEATDRITETDADYLKGFLWFLADLPHDHWPKIVADYAFVCLRKIPNIGPVSARIGFACVNTLAEMPGMEPVAQLTRLRVKVKYAVALKLIEKALTKAAERAGMGRDDLEDIAVPSYGLGADLTLHKQFGQSTVDVTLLPGSGEVEWHWKNGDGKAVKSAPADVKQNHAAELKELKRTATDMQKMLVAQKLRIEQFFINERKIGYDHWREHFLDHSLLSTIAKRLIWRFETDGEIVLGAWLDGKLVNWASEKLRGFKSSTIVELWHPLHSETQTILSWRCWLEDQRIVQPFKQAHREVYIVTPAEELTDTYSNRFAAHIIRQHQFASLCRERGWHYRLMGASFDGGNTPTLKVPRRSMSAEFWVDTPDMRGDGDPRHDTEQVSASGINLYLGTDQVRFYRNFDQMRMTEVPAMVFSEIMRDVDLFVGVCSIGNDPTWVDRGEDHLRGYWQRFAFADLTQSGETRKAILEKVLPQLKIASRCSIEGKYLVVRGDLHTYNIHLGSGNVLMQPGGRYLCIVPGRGPSTRPTGPLYLPFDGDQTLSVILSKAFLLAADTKITDESILWQIGNKNASAQ